VPLPGAGLVVAGEALDLRARVLVAGVVPPPRFGREGEVLATAAALRSAGADLVDVSLPARLLAPVARAGTAGPVAARVSGEAEAAAARRAGAAVVLVAAAEAEPVAAGAPPGSVAIIVDDLAALAEARDVAERLGLALAVDASRWQGPEAIAREAAAVALGCRLIRTADVRRSRRVAEVMGAVLGARRP
jgi:hypothetical protein